MNFLKKKKKNSEPFAHLSNVIRKYGGMECAENVKNAFQKIEENLHKILYIQDIFKLCTYILPFDRDIAEFYNGLINYVIEFINAYR